MQSYQEKLRVLLQGMAEEKYKIFNEKIVKGNMPMIGVRMPMLKKIAKEIVKEKKTDFIKTYVPFYHEEAILLGLVIAFSDLPYDEFMVYMNKFIEKIENWAVCDTFCGSIKKQVQNNKEKLWNDITVYSENHWVVRAALVIMLNYYLEEKYIKEVLKRCDNIKNDFYYVKIAQAWLIATAWVKCREETEKYLKISTLDKWTYNKAIQKACESNRVTEIDKVYLKTLKK